MNRIARGEIHQSFCGAKPDPVGDTIIHVRLYCRLLSLRGCDHQFFAGIDHLATAFQNAPPAVFFDSPQKLQPFVFPAHAAQPLAPAGECVVAHDALHAMVNGSDVDRVRATGAARPEETNSPRVHFGTRFEISDRVPDVLSLKLRQDQALLAFAVAKAAVIENQNGIPGFGEAAVIALVQLGVHQSQPTRTLHDSRPPPGYSLLRQPENPFHLRSFAVEGDLFVLHGSLSKHPSPASGSATTSFPLPSRLGFGM